MLFAEEGPGILNRLLGGVRDWLAEGLEPPAAVAEATAEYRDEMNVLQEFFDTCTVIRADLYVRAGVLFNKYKQWAAANEVPLMRQNEFADELKRRGFEKKRGHEGFNWHGLALKAEGVGA